MADPQLPRVQAKVLDAAGFASREWYDFFRDLVDVASQGVDQESQIVALQGAVTALEDAGSSTATLLAPQSVNITGTLAGGAVTFRLVGDSDAPGNTYRYGTGPTGIKGWRPVEDDFLEGTGVELTVGSNGVITIALDAATIASLALADTAVQPTSPTITTPSLAGLGNYVDDTAAAAGGVPVGGVYRNGSILQIRVT